MKIPIIEIISLYLENVWEQFKLFVKRELCLGFVSTLNL